LPSPERNTSPASPQPYQPFPVETLPAALAESARQGAQTLGCDAAHLALPALAVVASAVGGTRVIDLGDGWCEPCVIWSAIVAGSGSRRTAGFRRALWWPFRHQKSMLLVYGARVKRYRRDLRRMQESGRQAGDEFAGQGEELPERPVLERTVCVDIEVDTLAEILDANPRGALVARADLDSWLMPFLHCQRRDLGPDLAAWAEMFRAGMVFVDRGGESARYHFVHRAAVSLTGLLRPKMLRRALAAAGPASELAGRLVLAMPPAQPRAWSDEPPDDSVEMDYRQVFDRLRTLSFANPDDDLAPHRLTLSAGAKAAWSKFILAGEAENVDDDGPLSAALSELPSYAARFALLHHVVDHAARRQDDKVPVARASVDAGVALANWCSKETRRIYASLFGEADEARTRQLLEFLEAHGGRCTARVLMRSYSRRYRAVAEAEDALEGLVKQGFARWLDAE
jgi:hypothetical protein